MASIFKLLHNRFTKMPGNLDSRYSEYSYFRYLVTANYGYFSSGIIHFLLIFMFFGIGINALAIYNIASAIFWGLMIAINLKGYWKTALALAYMEVLLHSVLCTVFIGWSSNFHYFLLIFPIVVFLAPLAVRIQALSAGVTTGIYAVLSHISQSLTPLKNLDPSLLTVLHSANILAFCFVLSYVAYYYSQSAHQAEEKLQQANEKANAALMERNRALIRLNKELSEAVDYVRTMLPQPIKEGPVKIEWKFIPSTSLGGDAFGYHWLDDDNFAIYLLDVSGHGVGAALLSVSVMNTLRSQSLLDTDFTDPERVLAALNDAFPGEQNNDMFFTIWYGVYNKPTRNLIYASGGHPPAILFSGVPSRKSKMRMLSTKNNVIGGLPDVAYNNSIQQINSPSCLFIFSDGVYEIPKTDGRMWRLEEFSEFVRKPSTETQSDIDRIYQYARKLNQYDSFEDDFTIIEVVFNSD